MLITREISDTGDPSEKNQTFKSLKFDILCCRYWWFEIWKGQRMSFPYWRLYWNKNEGAYVYYEKKTYLLPDQLYLIPPHTPFSTGIEDRSISEESEYFFKCGRINSKKEETHHLNKGDILHFFTHFTLGFAYDNVKPGVYPVTLDVQRKTTLDAIIKTLLDGSTDFSLKNSLNVYDLIVYAINSLDTRLWLSRNVDHRIIDILEFIDRNTGDKLTSDVLASKAFMSPSAFSRLFKANTGKSPSKYLTQVRIDKACNLLLHTNSSIDTIAHQCGFTDRYHLTKVFTKMQKSPPAAFRKRIGYY